MTTLSAPRRRGKAPATFTITFTIGPDSYAVVPLRPDPAVASHAFRLKKQTGDRAAYDVHRDAAGHVECECPGFQRWRRPCKHVRALAAAKMLPASVLVPAARQEAASNA